jgi:hypothetical protein
MSRMNYDGLTLLSRLGDVINKWRIEDLGLEPVIASMGPDLVDWLRLPVTYCWSPALVPKPQDWGSNIGKDAIRCAPFHRPNIHEISVGFSCETSLHTHLPKILRGFCARALSLCTLDSVASFWKMRRERPKSSFKLVGWPECGSLSRGDGADWEEMIQVQTTSSI